MEIYKDKKFLFLLALFALLTASIYFFGTYSGIFLILALILFGAFSLMWKEKHLKIAGLVFLVLLALINIGINGMKFGIDFEGGTRIPIVLEKAVDQNTMDELVQTIKKRVNVLGLTEVKVRAVGSSQVNVEVPSGDEERISFIEEVLSHQGLYLGIVDGEVAITGENIFSTSIRPLYGEQLTRTRADWGISFSIDKDGAEQFADAAYGKADYPIYMYLDRPTDAVLFFTRDQLESVMLEDSGEKETVKSLEDALELNEENQTIEVYILDDIDFDNESVTPKTNKTKAVIHEDTPQEYKNSLVSAGFVLDEHTEEEILPEFIRTQTGVLVVQKLEAVGLLSSPTLSADITQGIPSYFYAITGSVLSTDPVAKADEARDRTKSMESILKGGSLPVSITLGSRTTLPASLGKEFLNLSLIGIAAALIVISIFIGFRYMKLRAIAPIIAISMAELAILLSILGSFTIDLAAMAGIIAAIGVGVDAQIVITDELLKKDQHTVKEKTDHAFAIIRTNVIVASLAMLPLLFSGLVEIIGFAISTILGSLLGYLLSRPAYAVIVEKVLGIEEKD